MKYKNTILSLLLGFIVFLPILPVSAGYMVEGVVPDTGQGTAPRNIASDQTVQFALSYGAHDPRDQVMSDLALYIFEGAIGLLFLLVIFELFKGGKQAKT